MLSRFQPGCWSNVCGNQHWLWIVSFLDVHLFVKGIHGLDIIHKEACYGLYLDVYMLPTSSHEQQDK
jgi:hypothetical protein